jgi:hypothetical protein
MSDERYVMLVAIHELIELVLCKQVGISEASVDSFDIAFEKEREAYKSKGVDFDAIVASEPGDDPTAPYYKQHQIATAIEKLLAAELGVKWNQYEREINSL